MKKQLEINIKGEILHKHAHARAHTHIFVGKDSIYACTLMCGYVESADRRVHVCRCVRVIEYYTI